MASLTYSFDNEAYFPVKDTIWLNNSVFVRLQGGQVFDFEVFINDKLFIPYGSPLRIITISIADLSATINKVSVRQRVKSGTGSLADKSRVEYAEFRSEFIVVFVDDNADYVPKITSVALEDGTVRVEWSHYRRRDFQYYKILKSISGTFQSFRTFTFANPNQNSFIDSTYVGGPINYRLVVNNGREVTSEPYLFSCTYNPEVTLEKAGDNYKLRFTPPPFYKNVKFYTTSFYNFVGGNEEKTTVNVSPADLSMDVPGPIFFGSPRRYEIGAMAKVENIESGDKWYATGLITNGKRIRKYNGWYQHDTNSPFYFCYVNTGPGEIGTMYKINDKTFEAIDSAVFPGGRGWYKNQLIISANGRYHYFLTETDIVLFNPADLSVISSAPYSSINSSINNYNRSGITVTDNNFIFFSGDSRGAFPCIVDMNTRTTIHTLENRMDAANLSSDGKFLVVGPIIYEYNGDTYEFYDLMPYNNISEQQFIRTGQSEVLILTAFSLVIYDCRTKTETFSIAGQPDNSNIVFDKWSEKVAYVDNEQRLFDIPSKTLRTVPVSPGYTLFSGGAFFTINTPNFPDAYVLTNF